MSTTDDLRAATERIRADHEHGASHLARMAAQALSDATAEHGHDDEAPSERVQALMGTVRLLADVRPSMAAVGNSVVQIWSAGDGEIRQGASSDDDALERLARMHAAANDLLDRWQTSAHNILEHARPLLPVDLFTFSRSGTVESVLAALAREGTLRQLWVARSFPGDEGLALANALVDAAPGLEITVIADAACIDAIEQSSAVVIGADSIWQDLVVNKVGTHPIALAAHAYNVPVYVLCETLKISGTPTLSIENMDPTEIVPHPRPGISGWNPYFEATPLDLMSAVITDEGILDSQTIFTRERQAMVAWSLLPPAHSQPHT